MMYDRNMGDYTVLWFRKLSAESEINDTMKGLKSTSISFYTNLYDKL